MHIAFVMTVSPSVRLLDGQLRHLNENGHDLTVISSGGEALYDVSSRNGARPVSIEMARPPRPFRDLLSLGCLVREFAASRPDVVVVGTPKASLLGVIAAKIVRARTIYTVRGLPLSTANRLLRPVLLSLEFLVCCLADEIVVDSHSLLREMRRLGILSHRRGRVIGKGSVTGIDPDYWGSESVTGADPNLSRLVERATLVVGFIGRVSKDKGIQDLLDCFDCMKRSEPGALLIVAGRWEYHGPDGEVVASRLRRSDVVWLGYVQDPRPVIDLFDVQVFPSAREGFGLAIVEAAARGVPTVGYRVTGVVDAIGQSGMGKTVTKGDTALLCRMALCVARSTGREERNTRYVLESFDRRERWHVFDEIFDALERGDKALP